MKKNYRDGILFYRFGVNEVDLPTIELMKR